MRPDSLHRRQRGLGLISVIFMITVGALLAAGMASMTIMGQRQTAQSFLSARAMQAAESGIQFELSRLIHPQTAGGCSTAATNTNTYNFNTPGLRDCSATVSCEVTPIQSEDYTTLISVGRCGGAGASMDTASRRIRVRTIRP